MEKLLDACGLVLVLHVCLTAEQADRAQLVAHDECLAIATELAIKWVVTHVPINRVDPVLAETLNYLLFLDVPEDQSATVAASHQELLKDWMWSQHPRVFLQLVPARSRQIIIKRLIHCVPDLYSADLFLEVFCLCYMSLGVSRVLNLTRYAGDCKATPHRPFNGVALAL